MLLHMLNNGIGSPNGVDANPLRGDTFMSLTVVSNGLFKHELRKRVLDKESRSHTNLSRQSSQRGNLKLPLGERSINTRPYRIIRKPGNR